MNKKTVFSVLAACILSSGAIVALNVFGWNSASYLENDVEVLANAEGCINAPDRNDGHCRMSGTMYFCVDSYFWERNDCVKKYN